MPLTICEILDQYLPHAPDTSWYRGADIPPKKLANAIGKYAPVDESETILALADGTVWKSAKEGVVLTDQKIYSRTIGGNFSLRWSEISEAVRVGGFPSYSLTITTHSQERHHISTACFDAQQKKLIEFFNGVAEAFVQEKEVFGQGKMVSLESGSANEPILAAEIVTSQIPPNDTTYRYPPKTSVSTKELNSRLKWMELCLDAPRGDVSQNLETALQDQNEQAIVKGFCQYIGFNKRLVNGFFVLTNRRMKLFSIESGAKIVFVETSKRLLGKLPVPFIDLLLGFFIFTIPGAILAALRGGKAAAVKRSLEIPTEKLLANECALRSVGEHSWEEMGDVIGEVHIGTGVWTSFNFLNRAFGVSFLPTKMSGAFKCPKDVVLEAGENVESIEQAVRLCRPVLQSRGLEIQIDENKICISNRVADRRAVAA